MKSLPLFPRPARAGISPANTESNGASDMGSKVERRAGIEPANSRLEGEPITALDNDA